MDPKNLDTMDKLVMFLAKRDGTDKVVKTLQYVGKLAHYKLQGKNPLLAGRCKNLEVACGMSRKVFRVGRSLTGINALRKAAHPDLTIQLLTMFGYSGEIVYWLLDHFTWLAKVGVLESTVADTTTYVSALGESMAYISFITVDVILIQRSMKAELALQMQLTKLEAASEQEENSANVDQVKVVRRKIATMRMQRIMWAMSIVGRTSDLCIAMSVVDPNPFVSHTVTMGLSGLASALVGWYQQWPA